jgi:hypothetical protein
LDGIRRNRTKVGLQRKRGMTRDIRLTKEKRFTIIRQILRLPLETQLAEPGHTHGRHDAHSQCLAILR